MKIAEIEYTPNPNAVKFVLKESITPMGITRSFSKDDPDESTDGVPLAQHLLALEGVISVFFADRWITVTQDGTKDWPELLRAVATPIRASTVEDAGPDAASEAAAAGQQPEHIGEGLDDPRMPMIREVLDDHIMPFLQGDGGGLEMLSLVDDTLMIKYQGACGTCPASLTGTLMAIENLLQMEVDPDLAVVTLGI